MRSCDTVSHQGRGAGCRNPCVFHPYVSLVMSLMACAQNFLMSIPLPKKTNFTRTHTKPQN